MTDESNIPVGAKLEVTLVINPDLWAEKESQGMTRAEIEKSIIKSVTLVELGRRGVVMDLENVRVIKLI